MSKICFSKLLEVNWDFNDDDTNWQYCRDNATFSHRESCEFILHTFLGEDEYFESNINEMKSLGCTEDFIKTYRDARLCGASRVLFWC
jgi:hypothetical protein